MGAPAGLGVPGRAPSRSGAVSRRAGPRLAVPRPCGGRVPGARRPCRALPGVPREEASARPRVSARPAPHGHSSAWLLLVGRLRLLPCPRLVLSSPVPPLSLRLVPPRPEGYLPAVTGLGATADFRCKAAFTPRRDF